MRVFGKLSFHILILLFVFYVNKEVQAADPNSENDKVNKEVQAAGSNSENDKNTEHVTDQLNGLNLVQGDDNDGQDDEQVDDDDLIDTEEEDDGIDDGDDDDLSDSEEDDEEMSDSIKEIKFIQKVDHFNTEDERTFEQRAFVERFYEQQDGPVVLQVGQLRTIYPKYLEEPTIQYLAQQLHAVIYVLENRYYGDSFPTNASSANLEKYSNTEQILADIKNFIQSSQHKDKKWIVYGLGHGGTLAGWFRLKYPDVASAALVFAAPFHAMTEVEYKYNALKSIPADQNTLFQEAFNQLYEFIQKGEFDELQKKFNMCTKIDEGNFNDNVKFLYWSLIIELSALINHYDLTRLLKDEYLPANELDKLASLVNHFYEKTCFQVNYNEAINKYKNEQILYESQIDYPRSLLLGIGLRPYFHQHCKEYGFFDTFRDDTFGSSSFGITIDVNFYTNLCSEVFEIDGFDTSRFKKLIDTMNTKYGGRDIQATNVISIIPNTQLWQDVGMAALKNNKSIILDNPDGDILGNEYETIVNLLREWTENVVPQRV